MIREFKVWVMYGWILWRHQVTQKLHYCNVHMYLSSCNKVGGVLITCMFYLSDRKRGRNYLIIFCIIFFKKWTCMNKIWVKMGSVLAGGRLICVLWILCRISRAIFSCQPSTNELKARWLHPQRQHAGYCTAFRLNSIFFFFQTFWFFKCAFSIAL